MIRQDKLKRSMIAIIYIIYTNKTFSVYLSLNSCWVIKKDNVFEGT